MYFTALLFFLRGISFILSQLCCPARHFVIDTLVRPCVVFLCMLSHLYAKPLGPVNPVNRVTRVTEDAFDGVGV